MLGLLGFDDLIETQLVLASAFRGAEHRPSTARQLAHDFVEYLLTLEPRLGAAIPADQYPAFVLDGDSQRVLLQLLAQSVTADSVDYHVPVRGTSGFAESQIIRQAVWMSSENWSDFGALLGLVFPIVVLAPSGDLGGGTASTVPGVLWASPSASWSETDAQEFLLHEFTHMCLMYDERRFGHYYDMNEVQSGRFMVPSAIRQQRRQLDKTFHSIVVATEILLARQRRSWPSGPRTLHPESENLLRQTEYSLRATLDLPLHEVLHPRPIQILTRCEQALASVASSRATSLH